MKTCLFILSAILVSTIALGQQWYRTYCDTGSYYCQFVQESNDKGFFVGGTIGTGNKNSILYKTDNNGNVLWYRIIGAKGKNSMVGNISACADGGCVLSGSIDEPLNKDAVFLMKLDACGQLAWIKKYEIGYKCSIYLSNVVLMKDGGYVFDFSTYDENNDPIGGLIRTNSVGDLLWIKHDDGTPENMYADSNDNIIYTGYSYTPSMSSMGPVPFTNVILVKYDSTGMKKWESVQMDYWNYGQQTLPSPGAQYLTFGDDVQNYYHQIYLYKWNSSGKLLWIRTLIALSIHEVPEGMSKINDTMYLLVVSELGAINNDYWMKLYIIDTAGKVLKDTVYKNNQYGIGPNGVTETSDGKYVIFGEIIKNIQDSGFYVLKIKPDLTQDSFSVLKSHFDTLCHVYLPPAENIPVDNAILAYSGLQEFMHQSSNPLSIFPNPAREYIDININGTKKSNMNYCILNMLGTTVQSGVLQTDGAGSLQQRVSIGYLSDGCYTIVVDIEGQKWIQKLMVY